MLEVVPGVLEQPPFAGTGGQRRHAADAGVSWLGAWGRGLRVLPAGQPGCAQSRDTLDK